MNMESSSTNLRAPIIGRTRMIDERPLLDEMVTLDLMEMVEVACGLEHPGLPGNYCVKSEDHWADDNGKTNHEDADGNEWRGMNYN